MLFEREDWKLFRNMETLTQKAGVSKSKLSMLVCKELADNALDVCGHCEIGFEDGFFYVRDQGPGLDPALFSINRPLRSSKYLRLPTRGALGNGLRVVAGAVAASGGELYVSTKGRRYRIHFQPDGTAQPESLGDAQEMGTMISFQLGRLPINSSWAQTAVRYAGGESYRGKTSPWWYTSENFFELFQAFGGTVRELIQQFDGCTGGKGGKIAALYPKTPAGDLTFAETEGLLGEMRTAVKNVRPARLGRIGEREEWSSYSKGEGVFYVESTKGEHRAEIPFAVEVYTEASSSPDITVLLNKSPITGEVSLYDREKHELGLLGCGLYLSFRSKPVRLLVNIMTPYMPLVTDGKEPDLSVVEDVIEETAARAVRRAGKVLTELPAGKKRSHKEIVADCLEQAIAKASGNGEYRFSLRQLYYAVRPYVIRESGREPDYNYFCRDLVGGYEARHGDIPLMYRDERGTLYHPHRGEDIPIGTIAVENYRKPLWTFNKVLYIEKEGFFNVLKERKIPEKYDMALLTSKGYASRAVRDLLDALGEHAEEEIIFFCIHDADAYGTTIYETLQNETGARPGRKVKIINLGLEPEEAVAMELEIEKVEKSGRRRGVASYIESQWEGWLQRNRVELNAMSTPQFLAWLEEKLQRYDKGKVIPPESVLRENLEQSLEAGISRAIAQEILEQHNHTGRVAEAVRQVKADWEERLTGLEERVREELRQEPVSHWQDIVEDLSETMLKIRPF